MSWLVTPEEFDWLISAAFDLDDLCSRPELQHAVYLDSDRSLVLLLLLQQLRSETG